MNPCKVEMTKYNILRKGKVIFWDVSESELLTDLKITLSNPMSQDHPNHQKSHTKYQRKTKWQNDQE